LSVGSLGPHARAKPALETSISATSNAIFLIYSLPLCVTIIKKPSLGI
jgi:hypothetical protein